MKISIIATVILLTLHSIALSEPFIVLKFSNQSEWSAGDGENEFSINPDHNETYKVKKGDSLNSIIKTFYGGSGLDHRFVQLALVVVNPFAFAKNNPNFLFSGKTMYLPGANEIKNLLMGIKVNNSGETVDYEGNYKNIYFFGG